MTSLHSDGFSISRVIRRTLDTLRPDLTIFLALGFLLVVLPQAGLAYFLEGDGTDRLGLQLSNTLASLIALLAKSSMTSTAMRTLAGKRNDLGDAVSDGMRLYFPAFGIGFLTNLGIALGFLLLIAPGIILMTWWSVALPARIANGEGVTDAIGKSRALTKGYRWHIAGLLGIAFIVFFVPPFAIATLGYGIAVDNHNLWVDAGLLPITSMVTIVLSAAGTSAIYHELIRLKGKDQSTADIFA